MNQVGTISNNNDTVRWVPDYNQSITSIVFKEKLIPISAASIS